jgi:hypothetical protein
VVNMHLRVDLLVLSAPPITGVKGRYPWLNELPNPLARTPELEIGFFEVQRKYVPPHCSRALCQPTGFLETGKMRMLVPILVSLLEKPKASTTLTW